MVTPIAGSAPIVVGSVGFDCCIVIGPNVSGRTLGAYLGEIHAIADDELNEVTDLNRDCFMRNDRIRLVGVAIMRQPVDKLPCAIGRCL